MITENKTIVRKKIELKINRTNKMKPIIKNLDLSLMISDIQTLPLRLSKDMNLEDNHYQLN